MNRIIKFRGKGIANNEWYFYYKKESDINFVKDRY